MGRVEILILRTILRILFVLSSFVVFYFTISVLFIPRIV